MTGNLIVKIFAPKESRHNSESVYKTELFGQARALSLGVPVPKICASGILKDKYDFPYIVSEFIDGVELKEKFDGMSSNEKYILDFADSILAPACIEHMTIALSTDFENSFIRGYFGEISNDELVDICFNGFMLSINGAWILANSKDLKLDDGRAFTEVESLADFKSLLYGYIKRRFEILR